MHQHELYRHPKHAYHPIPPTERSQKRAATLGWNERLAVFITKCTGTMWAAYAFACLALLGFPALSLLLGSVVAVYVVWLSQTFIQLTMLPILSVGQNVLSKHQEDQANEVFLTTERSFHDIEHIVKHLEAQDQELLKQTALLEQQLQQLSTLAAQQATLFLEHSDEIAQALYTQLQVRQGKKTQKLL